MKTQQFGELLYLDEWWEVDINIVIDFLVNARDSGATHLDINEKLDGLDFCTNAIELIPLKEIP